MRARRHRLPALHEHAPGLADRGLCIIHDRCHPRCIGVPEEVKRDAILGLVKRDLHEAAHSATSPARRRRICATSVLSCTASS